jgi:hypothetical protein
MTVREEALRQWVRSGVHVADDGEPVTLRERCHVGRGELYVDGLEDARRPRRPMVSEHRSGAGADGVGARVGEHADALEAFDDAVTRGEHWGRASPSQIGTS